MRQFEKQVDRRLTKSIPKYVGKENQISNFKEAILNRGFQLVLVDTRPRKKNKIGVSFSNQIQFEVMIFSSFDLRVAQIVK